MSGVPTIELRKGVEVPQIPVVWDTNLSNEELAEVYQHLLNKSFFFSKLRPDDMMTFEKSGGEITITGNWTDFEVVINGLTYRGWGTPKEINTLGFYGG